MWRTGSTVAAAVALMLAGAQAQSFQVTVTNKCSESLELYHVQGGEEKEMLAPGKSTSRTLPKIAPSHVFKKGRGGQATCAYSTLCVLISACSWIVLTCSLA